MGYRREDIVAIAIVSDGTKLAAPCGACRQVLVELLQQDTPIVLSNKQSRNNEHRRAFTDVLHE